MWKISTKFKGWHGPLPQSALSPISNCASSFKHVQCDLDGELGVERLFLNEPAVYTTATTPQPDILDNKLLLIVQEWPQELTRDKLTQVAYFWLEQKPSKHCFLRLQDLLSKSPRLLQMALECKKHSIITDLNFYISIYFAY